MELADETKVIAVTSYGHALCHMAELAFAAVLPAVMFEFELPADRAAALAIPGFILFGVGALPSGYWADRRGYREAFLGYYVCVAAAAIITFLSQTWWMLAVGLTLLGAAISIYHPVGMGILSHCSRRGRAMGINGVAGSFGIAIGPAIASLLVISGYSWRSVYLMVAAVAVLGCVFTSITRIDMEQHVDSGRRSNRSPSDVKPPTRRGVAIVLAVLFLTVLIGGFNYRCITTALPSYLSHARPTADKGQIADIAEPADDAASTSDDRKPNLQGAGIVFFVFAMGGVGQLAGGYLADRYAARYVYIATISLTIPFAILISVSSVKWGAVYASILAVFMFGQQPLENTMIAAATPARWRSTIYGLKFILAFGIASSGLYVAGYIWEYHGITHIFAFFGAVAFVMACCATCYAFAYRRVFA